MSEVNLTKEAPQVGIFGWIVLVVMLILPFFLSVSGIRKDYAGWQEEQQLLEQKQVSEVVGSIFMNHPLGDAEANHCTIHFKFEAPNPQNQALQEYQMIQPALGNQCMSLRDELACSTYEQSRSLYYKCPQVSGLKVWYLPQDPTHARLERVPFDLFWSYNIFSLLLVVGYCCTALLLLWLKLWQWWQKRHGSEVGKTGSPPVDLRK